MRVGCLSAAPLARLEIRDDAVRATLEGFCSDLDGPGGSARISVRRIAAWSLTAAAAIGVLIWFGMPFVADKMAPGTSAGAGGRSPDPRHILRQRVHPARRKGRIGCVGRPSAGCRPAGYPDEPVGVLAHEFGHIVHRDGIRRLIRDGGHRVEADMSLLRDHPLTPERAERLQAEDRPEAWKALKGVYG